MLTQNTLKESRIRRIPVDSHELTSWKREKLSAWAGCLTIKNGAVASMTFSHSLICCPVFRGCRGCFFCHPSQGFAYLFGLPCKLGLKSKHINVHLLGSTSQAKSPCQTQKSNIRKPAKAFLTYNDMKLFRKKHVNTCDVFQTSGICCTCICHESFLPSPLPASYALGSLVGFH